MDFDEFQKRHLFRSGKICVFCECPITLQKKSYLRGICDSCFEIKKQVSFDMLEFGFEFQMVNDKVRVTVFGYENDDSKVMTKDEFKEYFKELLEWCAIK